MMGFLVGFYIDNKYIGYSKVADNVIIPVGGTVEVTYTALVGDGNHLLTVRANDMLDILSETNKKNNSMSRSLSAAQVDFVDIEVGEISWTDASENKVNFNSEDPFQYSVVIKNIGSKQSDKPFFAHLYVDDKFVAKKQVGVLGAAGTVESCINY